MWVKICGITREEDAILARDAGADAIGIVLTRSSRRADPVLVGSWIHDLRGIEKVGVFMDEDPGHIEELGVMLGLDTIQLHAGLLPGHGALPARFGIIYAVKDLDAGLPPGFGGRILLDPSTGTGSKAEWRRHDVPFILAGGLTPENVRQAIIEARPRGVDVSSGVELSPGIKDPERVMRFIQEAKA
jgi:phosphoribosylanthranilate isomerase